MPQLTFANIKYPPYFTDSGSKHAKMHVKKTHGVSRCSSLTRTLQMSDSRQQGEWMVKQARNTAVCGNSPTYLSAHDDILRNWVGIMELVPRSNSSIAGGPDRALASDWVAKARESPNGLGKSWDTAERWFCTAFQWDKTNADIEILLTHTHGKACRKKNCDSFAGFRGKLCLSDFVGYYSTKPTTSVAIIESLLDFEPAKSDELRHIHRCAIFFILSCSANDVSECIFYTD